MKYSNTGNENIEALMNMFVAIKKLCVFYSLDQAVEVLDIYFKTNDPTYITNESNIRTFVVNSNIREMIFPLVDGKYNHLIDFINGLYPTNTKDEGANMSR